MDSINQIVIYKSPLKAIRMLFLSSLFVLPSIWMIVNKHESNIIYYFSASFFGLGYILSIFNLIDRRPQIIISRNGIIDRTISKEPINWNSIINAYLITIHSQSFISLETKTKINKPGNLYKWAVNFNKAIGGQEVNLNIGSLNVNKQQLLDLINELIFTSSEQRDLIIAKHSKEF